MLVHVSRSFPWPKTAARWAQSKYRSFPLSRNESATLHKVPLLRKLRGMAPMKDVRRYSPFLVVGAGGEERDGGSGREIGTCIASSWGDMMVDRKVGRTQKRRLLPWCRIGALPEQAPHTLGSERLLPCIASPRQSNSHTRLCMSLRARMHRTRLYMCVGARKLCARDPRAMGHEGPARLSPHSMRSKEKRRWAGEPRKRASAYACACAGASARGFRDGDSTLKRGAERAPRWRRRAGGAGRQASSGR